MYLLFLDESGVHGGAPVFVLGGLAVHEHDASHLQKRIEGSLTYRLAALGLDANDFELHAKNMRPGKEEWSQVPLKVRWQILGGTFRSLATYKCVSASRPCALFGAVVDAQFADREERAYDLVLNKFDEMLGRLYHSHGHRERGMVIHDRRVADTPLKKVPAGAAPPPKPLNMEQRIQQWTRDWQELANRVGVLHNFTHVPLFADSRATRLIQLADFVSWGLWRYYSTPTKPDDRWMRDLWGRFDNADGNMHGLIHVRPGFTKYNCPCPPCQARAETVVGS